MTEKPGKFYSDVSLHFKTKIRGKQKFLEAFYAGLLEAGVSIIISKHTLDSIRTFTP